MDDTRHEPGRMAHFCTNCAFDFGSFDEGRDTICKICPRCRVSRVILSDYVTIPREYEGTQEGSQQAHYLMSTTPGFLMGEQLSTNQNDVSQPARKKKRRRRQRKRRQTAVAQPALSPSILARVPADLNYDWLRTVLAKCTNTNPEMQPLGARNREEDGGSASGTGDDESLESSDVEELFTRCAHCYYDLSMISQQGIAPSCPRCGGRDGGVMSSNQVAQNVQPNAYRQTAIPGLPLVQGFVSPKNDPIRQKSTASVGEKRLKSQLRSESPPAQNRRSDTIHHEKRHSSQRPPPISADAGDNSPPTSPAPAERKRLRTTGRRSGPNRHERLPKKTGGNGQESSMTESQPSSVAPTGVTSLVANHFAPWNPYRDQVRSSNANLSAREREIITREEKQVRRSVEDGLWVPHEDRLPMGRHESLAPDRAVAAKVEAKKVQAQGGSRQSRLGERSLGIGNSGTCSQREQDGGQDEVIDCTRNSRREFEDQGGRTRVTYLEEEVKTVRREVETRTIKRRPRAEDFFSPER